MKKLIALICIVLPAPLHAGFGENVLSHWKEKVENLTIENAIALALHKTMITAKVPYAKKLFLNRMQASVTTSKPAIALLCDDITSRKAKALYPYVHDHFATIADFIDLRSGMFDKSSWDVVEEILRHDIKEFYELIPDWALGIEHYAEGWEIFFFERLFVRRIVEWDRVEFYDLVIDHFYDLLTEHDKEELGLVESDSD